MYGQISRRSLKRHRQLRHAIRRIRIPLKKRPDYRVGLDIDGSLIGSRQFIEKRQNRHVFIVGHLSF
jgi:hypothetical protein